jgi:hypothetical protein
MAFALDPRHGVASGLKRVVRKQLDNALEALSGRPELERLHQVRRCVKKTRAVLRLFDEAHGPIARQQKRLRSVGHHLSALRDAQVLSATLQKLQAQHRHALARTVMRRVQDELSRHTAGVHDEVRACAAAAKRRLEKSRRKIPGLVHDAGRFPETRDGFVHGYRRARKLFESVSLDSEAAQFHRWRRRVKDHWYHVRLFERSDRAAHARAGRLKTLETWLGEEHDLATLRQWILENGARFDGLRGADRIVDSIGKARTRLRRQSLRLGRELFAPKPRELRRAVTEWWRAARR